MTLELRHAFDIEAHLAPTRDLGVTPHGRRRIVPIVGGTVRGRRLEAEILPGGADWQRVRGDGVVELVARYSIRTADGIEITVTNRGLRRAPPDVMERM